MDIREKKKEIRRTVRELKSAIIPQSGNPLSLSIQERLLQLEEVSAAKTILLYYSLPDEVGTTYLLEKLSSRLGGEKRVILPVVDGDDLILKEYRPESISGGYCNIMEPEGDECVAAGEIDLAIIPGVAFDRGCNRLGRGKGFYDRLLPQLNCRTIGLAFGFQMVDEIPCEPFDRPLDMVITENALYKAPL